MNPLNQFSVLQTVITIGIALLTVFCLRKYIPVYERPKRETVLDGLRGYLAFIVFLHHSVLWFYLASTGKWNMDDTHFFFNYGRDGVALFFMITAFLFWGKLIRSKRKPISWTQLYISRIFRIVPLYLFVVLIVFICVGIVTHFTLQQSIPKLLSASIKWLSGGIINATSIAFINDCPDTAGITAGVMWTLSLEWLFYFSLPLWGVLFYRTRINYVKLILLMVFAGGVFYYFNKSTYGTPDELYFHFKCFGVGILAAYLFTNERFGKFAASIWASIIVSGCLVGCFGFTRSYTTSSLVLMGIAFVLIACGNDIFGLLSCKISRRFGQLSYSIYLLHGALLFISIRFVLGKERVATFSIAQYWVFLYIITILLVIVATLTFNLIEQPGINAGHKIIQRLKKKNK